MAGTQKGYLCIGRKSLFDIAFVPSHSTVSIVTNYTGLISGLRMSLPSLILNYTYSLLRPTKISIIEQGKPILYYNLEEVTASDDQYFL